MELSVTIKEILPLLENKLKLLEEGINKRKVIAENNLLNLKESIKSVDNYIREAQCVNYQELIQEFIYVKETPAIRSKWIFFKENYTATEEHLDTYKLESYLQRTFNLRVALLDIINVARYGKHRVDRFTTKLGGFYFKGVYYSINYTKDSFHRRKEESARSVHSKDHTLSTLQISLGEVITFQKELLHLQKVFGESKVITLNEKQIKLIGE